MWWLFGQPSRGSEIVSAEKGDQRKKQEKVGLRKEKATSPTRLAGEDGEAAGSSSRTKVSLSPWAELFLL
jgi:hypothetical protein